MARAKRVPYRPDRFQSGGRLIASWILQRGTVVGLIVFAAAVMVIVTAAVLKSSAAAEELAWSAYHKAGSDTASLRAALEEYSSGAVRPYLLMSLGRVEAEPPLNDEGKPKDETDEARLERLQRAEEALEEIVSDYPRHYLRIYALMLLGQVKEQRGVYAKAVATFREALDSEPGSLEPKLHYDIGRNLYLAGDVNDARMHLERAVELSSRMLYIPQRWGGRPQQVEPVWRANAKYLLAAIGKAERSVISPAKAEGEPATGADGAAPEDAEKPAEEIEIKVPINKTRDTASPKVKGPDN